MNAMDPPKNLESKTPSPISSVGGQETHRDQQSEKNKSEVEGTLKDQEEKESNLEGEDEEEEEGECGFCLFMKGGGCKETFIDWEKCIEEVEKKNGDIVEKCFEATAALKKCMEAHSDYYNPILQAEKAAEDEAIKELEKDKEKEKEKDSQD